MSSRKLLIIGLLSLVFYSTALAQYSLSFRMFAPTIRPAAMVSTGGENTMEAVNLEPGAQLSLEAYLGTRRYSLKLNQSVQRNFHHGLTLGSQVQLRVRWYHRKHAVAVAIGPSMFLRTQSPHETQEYESLGAWDYRLMWLSGELEYEYYLNAQWRVSASLLHSSPGAVAPAAGLKFFFNSRKKDCNCPSFQKY